MERRFFALTGLLSALTFGGVWMATAPVEAGTTTGAEGSAAGAPPPAPVANIHYSGCREARAAGVTPLHVGDPGYRTGMDGDGDGVACEDYSGGYSGSGNGGSSHWGGGWSGRRRRR